jgi:hypothetical protein
MPEFSILQDNHFVPAPVPTDSSTPNAARIFDSLDVAANEPPESPGVVPLSPDRPSFSEQRYWRLPVNPGAILMSLLLRVGYDDYECEEITIAQRILNLLNSARLNRNIGQPTSDNVPGDKGGPDGRGPGGDSTTGKRKTHASDHSEPPKKKRGQTKARDCTAKAENFQSGDKSGELLRRNLSFSLTVSMSRCI